MKTEGSLPVSRAPPPTDPHAVPDESSWHPPILVKIHFNIILLSVHRSFKWLLSFKFSNQNTGQIPLLSHACHMLHPCHHLRFSPPILYVTKHKKWNSSLCSFTQPSVPSSLLAPNIFLHTPALAYPQSRHTYMPEIQAGWETASHIDYLKWLLLSLINAFTYRMLYRIIYWINQ